MAEQRARNAQQAQKIRDLAKNVNDLATYMTHTFWAVSHVHCSSRRPPG